MSGINSNIPPLFVRFMVRNAPSGIFFLRKEILLFIPSHLKYWGFSKTEFKYIMAEINLLWLCIELIAFIYLIYLSVLVALDDLPWTIFYSSNLFLDYLPDLLFESIELW